VKKYGMPKNEKTNDISRSSDPANIPMPKDLSIRLIIVLLERPASPGAGFIGDPVHAVVMQSIMDCLL
jgi:hypothetical protein